MSFAKLKKKGGMKFLTCKNEFANLAKFLQLKKEIIEVKNLICKVKAAKSKE